MADIFIGVDPGLATGVVGWADGKIVFAEQLTVEEVYQNLQTWAETTEGNQVHIQCEWFTISQRTVRTAVQYESLHLIGAIQYQAFISGWTLAYTNPADVKGRFPDPALRKAGLWHTSDHVRDATRHLLVPLVAQGLFDAKALLL